MNRKQRRAAAKEAVKNAKKVVDQNADVQVSPREQMAAALQDDLIKAIEASGAVNKATRTVDSHLIVECFAATMIPFALMGDISEDVFAGRMRALYRQINTTLRLGGQAPSRIIVPGQA